MVIGCHEDYGTCYGVSLDENRCKGEKDPICFCYGLNFACKYSTAMNDILLMQYLK